MIAQIIVLLILLQIFNCQGQDKSISGVFSPIQLNQLSYQKDQLWAPLHIKVAADVGLVFLSYGFRGISIINQEGNKILHQQDFSKQYVQVLETTQNGQYIFIAISQTLYVFNLEFQNQEQFVFYDKKFNLVQNITFDTNILISNYNQQSEILALATQGGQIFIYNTTAKDQLQALSIFNLGSNTINSVFISNDGKWIYIASDLKGLFVLRLQQNSQKNNGLESQQISMVVAGYGTYGLRACQVISTKNNDYVFALDFWYGFFYASTEEVVKSEQSKYPIKLSFKEYWPFKDMEKTCQALCLNQDETLLFLGVRSYGILILDISNKSQIQVFQLIQLDSLIYSINLSKQEDYLYVSTLDVLLTYDKDKPNLNQDLPNLYNTHQIKYQEFLSQQYKWRCYIDDTQQYLIGAFDAAGLYIFPFGNDPYSFDVNKNYHYDVYVDSIYFEKDNKYIVLPRYFSKNNLGIYQYSPLDDSFEQQQISYSNMKLVKDYTNNQLEISEMIVFSTDSKFAVQVYAIGLLIYDSTDIFNLKLLSRWNNLDFMIGENQGVCFTRDNKWIYSTIRFFGVYLLNVEDKSNPILIDYIRTNGGENVIMSQIFDVIYLVDGVQGFAIIDSSCIPKLQIISRIDLSGHSLDALFFNNESYALVTQLVRGFLTLIDIKDKRFPFIVNSILYGNQYSQALCITQTKYLFVATSEGIIVFPMFSQVQIHTHVSLIQNNKETGQNQLIKFQKDNLVLTTGSSINEEYIFSVGQQIQFNFAILYPNDYKMEITNIYCYIDGQVKKTLENIQFNQLQQSVILTIDKSFLNLNSDQPNLNILLVRTILPLNPQSFIFISEDQFGKEGINSTQSQMIYSYLNQKKILNKGIISDKFDFEIPFSLETNFQKKLIDPSPFTDSEYKQITSKINEKIKSTLVKSYYINPIKFYVQTSLFFDNNNVNEFIKSNSQNIISVTLSINSRDGKLIFNSNLSIVFQLSDSQNQLVIQGSTENINRILQGKIIFANSTQITAQNSPNITLIIQDNINYPLVKQYTIHECQFITLKQQLKVKSENSLQQQIEKYLEGGIADIDTDYIITFAADTFIVSDSQDLTYKCFYLQSSNQFIPIPQDYWLSLSSNIQLSLKVSTTQSMYKNSYTFKIIASDGYTQAEDIFSLKVSRIPFSYVFNLLIKILGPILFVLGIYQEKNIFLNIYYRKRVTFSQEIILCDELYVKKIVILGETQRLSKQILSRLFHKIQNMKNQSKKQELQDENRLKKKEKPNRPQKMSKNEQNIQKKMSLQNFIDPPDLNNIHSKKLTKLIENFKKQSNHNRTTVLEQRYLNYDGNLLMSKVIQDIQQHKICQTIQYNSFQDEIHSTDSKIFRALRAQLSYYFLNLDNRSLTVYRLIKCFCLQKFQRCENDWYKSLIEIDFYDENYSKIKKGKTFPKLEIKFDILIKIFQFFGLFPLNLNYTQNTFESFIQQCQNYQTKINIYLIREVLFGDTLGFNVEEPSKYKVAYGQSLHIDPQSIKQIVAYKKRKINKFFRSFFQFFNMEYSQLAISKNMRLPSWLYLDQKKGVIILHGIPRLDDIEQILLRIYDTTGFVIQQFTLKVIQNQNQQKQSNNIDEIYGIADEIIFQNNFKNPFFIKNGLLFNENSNKIRNKKQLNLQNYSFQMSLINQSNKIDQGQSLDQINQRMQSYQLKRQKNTKTQLEKIYQLSSVLNHTNQSIEQSPITSEYNINLKEFQTPNQKYENNFKAVQNTIQHFCDTENQLNQIFEKDKQILI